jgi:O-antigen/teichoic acid export membrane protein
VTNVATCLIPALDRAMITNFLGLESTGHYAIGYRYAFMMMLPIQAFMNSWIPFTLSIYKEDDAEQTYNRGLILMTAGLSLLVVVMISLVEPVIELVASARYLPGHIVALPLMIGLVLQAISHLAGLGISLSKQTRYTMYGYLIGVAASAVFIYLLVRPFGILGAAYGVLLGRAFQSFSYVFFAYRVYPLRFAMKRPAVMVAFTAVAGFTLQAVEIEPVFLLIAFRTVVVLLFSTLIWFAMFDRDERDKAVTIARGYLRRTASDS